MIAAAHRLAAFGLRQLDPERAHAAAVRLLSILPLPPAAGDDPLLAVEAFGLRFANPVGLAAGFDKDAAAVSGAWKLGFGFTEVGTLTPKPQAGNPRPRVFRLPADGGVINRYGFNNAGHEAAQARLRNLGERSGVLGVNIGANKDSIDRTADYLEGLRRFADVADYFTLNVSSPNTPGLRDLQFGAALDDLLARATEARDTIAARGPHRPLLLKIAPDLDEAALDDIVSVARARRIDGMIVSNTTLSRPQGLADVTIGREAGGLSGAPLYRLSTQVLAQAFLRVERQFPLIGVGGIDSAETAIGKIRAGATLIQLYSGLIYRGAGLAAEIKRGMARIGAPPSALIGVDAKDVARGGRDMDGAAAPR